MSFADFEIRISFMKSLPQSLRTLIHDSVAVLGEVLEHQIGRQEFRRIESLRARLKDLRNASDARSIRILSEEFKKIQKLSPQQQMNIAKGFTLMLELMNTCENAFRSYEIRRRHLELPDSKPEAIFYVLTAHPTEARSPQNIWIFHSILLALTETFVRSEGVLTEVDRRILKHNLEIAWRLDVVRAHRPKVQDEAEHIYSTLLRDETLLTLLRASSELAPIYLRSWVGGDKDGHPGVDEKVFSDSLHLSRGELVKFCQRRLKDVSQTLQRLPKSPLRAKLQKLDSKLILLRKISAGDGKRILFLKKDFQLFFNSYEKEIGYLHPSLLALKRAFHIFPALVVPLEFRESSDVLLSSPEGKGLAIYRMLQTLQKISKGGDARWYVRGFIVSMTGSIEHLQLAAHLTEKATGSLCLPIIPLFEQAAALDHAQKIAREMLNDPKMSAAIKRKWNGRLEMMLGYSDSSKESGVLPSRLKIAETMHQLDRWCRSKHVTPLFFQGSGGSTDRGGGSIAEQTAWWSAGALKNYKVTIQGEMVERALANPDITRGQIERILQSAGRWPEVQKFHLKKSKVLDQFANLVAEKYRATIQDPGFLRVIEHATPYQFLDLLKFGSRPTKRASQVSVAGLRAIPWSLCWTQVRLQFPTWWGIGTAWSKTSAADRRRLLKEAKQNPLLSSYLHALSYTLEKVQLPIWRLYLDQSELTNVEIEKVWADFNKEYKLAVQFVNVALKERKLTSFKPWLQESIMLRSPMIHPLNLLQIIAVETKQVQLLRVTVAGISSGMMTTG
jgi:phosphoenolpyruvate carboxylase